MADRPAKRARYTSDTSAESFNVGHISACIDILEVKTIKSILLTAAKLNGEVCEVIKMESGKRVQTENAKVLSFDNLSKSAWKAINVTYGSMSGSKQYNMSFEVQSHIKGSIKRIRLACNGPASFGTKKNGLETLRKVGKTIAMSEGDTMAHEVRKAFQGKSDLETTMMEIVKSMTVQERDVLAYGGNPPGQWLKKLVKLEKLADGYCLFEELGPFIAFLRGKGDADENDEDEDEEEAEDDAADDSDEGSEDGDEEDK